MERKIVAIGGGANGKRHSDGRRDPYELEALDREIIRLTGKAHPHLLFIAHAKPTEKQADYFALMSEQYSGVYGCECRTFGSERLSEREYVSELVEWADIIYEGGGNTLNLMGRWREAGFDDLLRRAWESGKVVAGVSAGANCWFDGCCSDSLKSRLGPDAPMMNVPGLGLARGMFVPHCDEPDRSEQARELSRGTDETVIMISNRAALEIVDDSYRLLLCDPSTDERDGVLRARPYGERAYWDGESYRRARLPHDGQFRPLSELFLRNIDE